MAHPHVCRRSFLTAIALVLAGSARLAQAAPIVVHESTESFFESGGTHVTNCFGLGCSAVSFEFGTVSGEVLWQVEEKVFHDVSTNRTTFTYAVFNETLTPAISAFRVANAGFQGDGQAPAGWTFSQSGTTWAWEASDPLFGIEAGLFLDGFSLDVAGLIDVGFDAAALRLADDSIAVEHGVARLHRRAGTGVVSARQHRSRRLGGSSPPPVTRRIAMAFLTRASLAAVILVACLPSADSPPGATQLPVQPLRIIQPLDGALVVSDRDTEVIAELAPQFRTPETFDSMAFVVTSVDGTRRFDLGRGDLRLLEGMDRAGSVWRTGPLPSGEYVITASLQDRAGNIFEDRVRVTLNRAPGAIVQALRMREVPGGAEVTLQGIVQDIENDPLDRIRWTPGDGSDPIELGDLSPFAHVYTSVPGQITTYVAAFTVEDARGGSTTVQRDVVVDATGEALAINVLQTHDCGCEEMRIFSRANTDTFTYCSGGGAPAEPGCRAVVDPGACPQFQTAFRCPLGPYSPGERGFTHLGWTFEVDAVLDPGTNQVSRCTEGQVARRSWTFDGRAQPNGAAKRQPPAGANLPFPAPRPPGRIVNGPNPYPPVAGPDWGAGRLHATSHVQAAPAG